MVGLPTHPRVFISAAEPSADLHASSLISAVNALAPGVQFCGVTGPKMRVAGCKSIYDMTKHSAMLTAAVGHLHHAYQMVNRSGREMAENRYDLAVVIDAPTLNLQVAKLAKSLSIPVLYYIAPQTWAWAGRFRINRVRQRVDRVACIWPFEEPYFRCHGIDADYVGHPLFARLLSHDLDENAVQELRSGDGPVLTIMPGSRRHVVRENFTNQLTVARAVRQRFPALRVLVSVANGRVKSMIREATKDLDFPVELHERENAELLRAADLALVVSGTITLEAAYHRTPMIVMYNASRGLYRLFRWLISTQYLSLPNILAGRELVPEFMPYYVSPEPIIDQAVNLLSDADARRQMSDELGKLVSPFIHTTASETTARILMDMIEVCGNSGASPITVPTPRFDETSPKNRPASKPTAPGKTPA